jgi:hypothetical protein
MNFVPAQIAGLGAIEPGSSRQLLVGYNGRRDRVLRRGTMAPAPVVPENSIRADSHGEGELAHHRI